MAMGTKYLFTSLAYELTVDKRNSDVDAWSLK